MLCAIDPGLTGGIVIYDFSNHFFTCSEIDTSSIPKLKTFVFPFLDKINQVVIEKPLHIKGTSHIKSIMTAFMNFGKLLAFFEIHDIPISIIPPQAWTPYFKKSYQKAHAYHSFDKGFEKLEQKEERLAVLTQQYQLSDELFRSKKGRLKDGIVDAFCLAFFFQETYQNGLSVH